MAEVQFYSAPGRKRLKPITHNSLLYLSIPSKELLEKLNNEYAITKDKATIDNVTQGKKRLKKIHIIQCDNALNKHHNLIENLPKVQWKRMFIFGDIVAFIKRYEQYHLSVIYTKVSHLMKRYEALRRVNTVLFQKHITYRQFDSTMRNCCYIMKREIGFKKRCEVIQLVKYIPKILKMILLNKLKQNKKAYIDSVIKLQKQFRGYTNRKQFIQIRNSILVILKVYRRHYTLKKRTHAIVIQKTFRRKSIQIKYANKLSEIKDHLRHERRKKEYERKRDLVTKKREAVHVIEKYWNKVLERRYLKQLEEQLSKMSPDYRDLYRKFLLLRRETRNLKRDLIEFSQKEAKKG